MTGSIAAVFRLHHPCCVFSDLLVWSDITRRHIPLMITCPLQDNQGPCGVGQVGQIIRGVDGIWRIRFVWEMDFWSTLEGRNEPIPKHGQSTHKFDRARTGHVKCKHRACSLLEYSRCSTERCGFISYSARKWYEFRGLEFLSFLFHDFREKSILLAQLYKHLHVRR